MKLYFTAIVLFALSLSPLFSVAQQTSSKTLLWRISGNGLQKPSYLYGTMHLKDRRLFFFGDSVYKSIEASQGFAMELDPNEMMDSMFSKLGEADTTSLLRKLLDEKKFKSVAKKLEKKFGMPADKISRKQLIKERENWYYNVHKSDDMRSVVDLYLYDIAHKQGKWVGGVEDVNDQMGIQDELGKDVNITEYIDDDNDAERKNYMEKMVAIYTDQDIDKLDVLFNGSQSQKTRDILLVHRNIKMSQRMDSLAHIRNSFFAVGAAHLPGETGLIHLLRDNGFAVTPVFSSKKIAPEKYTYKAKEIPWIKFYEQDSAYAVEMPGKASDLNVASGEVKFKVYADVVSNIAYMTGYSFLATDEKPEELMGRMIRSFLSKGFEKKEEKKIANKGTSGSEITAVMGNIYYRLQIFPLANKVFIVMAGGEKKENLYSNDVEKFLTSFTMNTLLVSKPKNWVDHTDPSKAFEISFPKKPSVDKLKTSESVSNIETTTYTALDISNNAYYLVVVSETKKGFILTADSITFNAKLDYYKQSNSIVTDQRIFRYEDNGAMSFSAQTSKDGLDYITKLLIICRGNRTYTIAAVTQKGKEDYPDITRFFRSFKLDPYKESKWQRNAAHGNVFSTWSPSGFEQQQPDTSGKSAEEIKNELNGSVKEIQFLAHEPYAATTYNINIHPVSKYYHAKSDSIFLAGELGTYFSDTSSVYAKNNPGRFDSLIYKKAIANGGVKGFEILVKNNSHSYYKRIRVLPHGDSAYHLFVLAPYAFITNENNNKFFNDFRFSDEALSSGILKNKTSLILTDITNKDSATKAEALTALDDATFDTADLPLLYEAYLKQYPVDSAEYTTINEKIGNAINKVHDSSTISFVKSNYISGTVSLPELKMDMLEMLAKQRTRPAVSVLKELLLKSPPLQGYPNSFIYKMRDSLLLAKDLFPEAARFFGDSILGPGMIRLASELTDSNMLQVEILTDNVEGIIHTANAQLLQLKKDKDGYAVNNNYVIDVLGKINNMRSVGLLNGFLKIADLEVKQNAALALLKIKQTVSPLDMRKIAADIGYRTSFYKALKNIGKQELFPAEFFTQQQFAEGYVYNYVTDQEVDNILCKPIGEKVASINGEQRRFFLYKLSYSYEDEAESHFAICGPFKLNRKIVALEDKDLTVQIFYDEKYTPTTVNKLFDQFINDKKKDISPVSK